jgi:ubiquinone/menaquinone biosynthesis C-methylase UbiE
MADIQRTYLPAAGKSWAMPLYDPLVKLLGFDATKRALIGQANLAPGHRVLEIGCGTGTLATMIKRQYPNIEVVGLDPDPKALARAKRKAGRVAASIRFDQGFADELPYSEACFDRVFSSFMFHHLHAELREKTLREVRRVLAPGGSLHLVDLARPEERAAGRWARLVYSSPQLKDNTDSRILSLLSQVGFAHPAKAKEELLLFGTFRVAFYQASVTRAG